MRVVLDISEIPMQINFLVQLHQETYGERLNRNKCSTQVCELTRTQRLSTKDQLTYFNFEIESTQALGCFRLVVAAKTTCLILSDGWMDGWTDGGIDGGKGV